MSLDPSVQVALITVVTTLITTAGVVYVAVMNNTRERKKAADVGVEEGLDESKALASIAHLANENSRKEGTITRLRSDNQNVRAENVDLREDNERLTDDNRVLREDNHNLRDDNERLRTENERLRQELGKKGQP